MSVAKQRTRAARARTKQTIVQNKRFVRAVPRAVPNLQIQHPRIPQRRKPSTKRQEARADTKTSSGRKAVRARVVARGMWTVRTRAGVKTKGTARAKWMARGMWTVRTRAGGFLDKYGIFLKIAELYMIRHYSI